MPMKIFFNLLFIFAYFISPAQLRLSAFFGDHMILQRDKPVKIWGAASPGEQIRVHIGRVESSTKADLAGHWMVSMPAFAAGGPYILQIQTHKETKVVSDILFGEVWLCSGQSNMEFKVRDALHGKQDIHRALNPLIREFHISRQLSLQPESFIDSGSWVMSSPQTTGEFTAVGYFFALDIFEKLHVPVGLIDNSWGGSQVESWISQEAMQGSAELKDYARQMPERWDQNTARIEQQYSDSLKKWFGGKVPDLDRTNILQAGYAFSGWMPAPAPGAWDWSGLPGYRGEGYMVKEIWLDSIQSALPSLISLGLNDIRFSWFVNGNPLAKTKDKIFQSSFAAKYWKTGKNILLLEIGPQPVTDGEEMGLRGNADQFYLDFDGEKIWLADGQWKMLPALNKPHHFMRWMNSEGTIIYNAMLHPLIPFGIRGVLWYQGETNTGRAFEYRKTFPFMIESWRKEWQDDFYFLFVQLANFGSSQSSNAGSDWAELREAQRFTLQSPKTGMAVTIDIGDPKDIHPKNKQEVGGRLAAIALNDVYGFKQTHGGPDYDSVYFSTGKAYLFFKSVGRGLWVKDQSGYLRGFEIAGADKKFYYARAQILGDCVEVYSDSVTHPVAVRYGWSNSPDGINLYNQDGFPASPFRTDAWPGVTDPVRFYQP